MTVLSMYCLSHTLQCYQQLMFFFKFVCISNVNSVGSVKFEEFMDVEVLLAYHNAVIYFL